MEQEVLNALVHLRRGILDDVRELIRVEVVEPAAVFRNETLTSFDAVFHRLANVEQEQVMTTAGLRRVEGRLDHVEGRLTTVETRLTGVETRLTGVETRLTNVEDELVEVRHDIADLRKERA